MAEVPVPERDGARIVNVRDARWVEHPQFGRRILFEGDDRFEEIGVNIAILQPGQPNCRYHRESVQENFLVLSGRCKLLVNGEERSLEPWDLVHCPPGVSHVFVGDGDGPCAILMMGARRPGVQLFYPEAEVARPYGAESSEPTADPRVAYGDVEPLQPIPAGEWPPGSR